MSILRDVKDFFFPRTCACCNKILSSEEEELCFECLSGLPYVSRPGEPGNEVERMFWGAYPVEKAASLCYYSKGGNMAEVLRKMKYNKRKTLCSTMGKIMATALADTGIFEGVDYLLPVPLHKERLCKRGYNQSELLAQGISFITHIPLITNIVIRTHNNATQTHKSGFDRWQNVEGLFGLSEYATTIENKHIMIIDDVLTTGATVSSCIDALKCVNGIKISVATLAWAK